jgi:hypothetical protein
MLERPGWSCSLVLLLFGAPACEEHGSCGETTVSTLTDLDAVPSGFSQSPAALLEAVAGDYAGELRWNANDGPITVAHAQTASPLTLSVGATPSAARLIAVERDGQYPTGQEGGSLCSSAVEIDVEVAFSTDDGLFAERWLSTLTLRKQDAPSSTLAFAQSLDFDTHEGSLAEDDFAFAGDSVARVSVDGRIGDATAGGSLHMYTSGSGAGPVAFFDADLQ